MQYTRRSFLKRGTTSIAGTALASAFVTSRDMNARVLQLREEGFVSSNLSTNPRWQEIAQRGIESARKAGAQYADARITFTRDRTVRAERKTVIDIEAIHIGVRALAGGYWGFASGPVWDGEEIVRLAREAVAQAKNNILGKTRVTELIAAPVVTKGQWTTPIQIDPFDVHPMEVLDFLNGISIHTGELAGPTKFSGAAAFTRQDKVFASTEGSSYTQRVYRTSGEESQLQYDRMAMQLDTLNTAGMGWELFDRDKIHAEIEEKIEEAKADLTLPVQPVDVGRYPVVFHPRAVAKIVSGTIGAASELDRALGFEANAGGTSYLAPPDEILGKFKVGSPLVTITANRTEQGGLATVQWDDDAVVPRDFPVVQDGVLVNYHTGRESAAWLVQAGHTAAAPASYGCAYAPTAVEAPLVHTSNLTVLPGREAHTITSLCERHSKAIYFEGMATDLDFQQLNGWGMALACFEMSKGKKVARIAGAGILFRAPEFWKEVKAIGGVGTSRRYSQRSAKGEPSQTSHHSVTTVPIAVDSIPLIDVRRKA